MARPSVSAALSGLADVGEPQRPAPGQWIVTIVMFPAMLATTALAAGPVDALGRPALITAVAVIWAPLLARTWAPAGALVAVVVAESAFVLALTSLVPWAYDVEPMGALQPVPLASMLAVFTVAERAPAASGWFAGGLTSIVLTVAIVARHPSELWPTSLTIAALVLMTTGLGVMVTMSRERAELANVEHVRHAIVEERLRIARELHDVLAHKLMLVNAKAGVAAHLMDSDPGAASTALREITSHTARAVEELGLTVGLLRSSDDADAEPLDPSARRPVPGADRIGALVDSFTAAGVRVELHVHGTVSELAPQTDLALYRIVQEAVTNAGKHAPRAAVSVHIRRADDHVSIAVVNAAPPDQHPAPAAGTGNGLIGMRERASSAGGTFRSGPRPGGGYEVVAELPTDPPSGGGDHVDGVEHHEQQAGGA